MSKTHNRTLLLCHHHPENLKSALETLDLIYAYAALDYPLDVVFLHDGVLQLSATAEPLSKMLRALPELEIKNIYVLSDSLQDFSLSQKQLCMNTTLITNEFLAALMHDAKAVLQH